MLEKASRILRLLGSAGSAGATTSAVATECRLSRPTTHRILTALTAEGLVDRDAETGRWLTGPELFLLGATAAERYDVTQFADDILGDLAEQTGESAFLSARRGLETVCLAHREGSFPLRSHVLYEGIRFPLGVASAGLVVLAHLPPEESHDYIQRVDLTRDWGRSHSKRALTARVAQTREAGYAVNPGLLVEGSWGVAAPVFDRNDQPTWALSLTGVETRFRPERLPSLGRRLLRSAHALTRRMARSRS